MAASLDRSAWLTSDGNDRAIVGKARPRWSGGWRNTFTFKEWELSFFIYARWKFTVPAGSVNLDGRYAMRSLDYWVAGENEGAEYYGPGTNGQSADTYAGSMNYQDGSYISVTSHWATTSTRSSLLLWA